MATFSVVWSEEDQEWVGLCDESPSLSWLAKTPEEALEGINRLVENDDPVKLWQVLALQEQEIASLNRQLDALYKRHDDIVSGWRSDYTSLHRRFTSMLNAVEQWYDGFRPVSRSRKSHRTEMPFVNVQTDRQTKLIKVLLRHYKYVGKL